MNYYVSRDGQQFGPYSLADLRCSLWAHFNGPEPINLKSSGPMTFFFNTIYFQYHFNRIYRWRTTGILQ